MLSNREVCYVLTAFLPSIIMITISKLYTYNGLTYSIQYIYAFSKLFTILIKVHSSSLEPSKLETGRKM